MAYGKDIGATETYGLNVILLMAPYLGSMKHIIKMEFQIVKRTMQDREINQRNVLGQPHGYWEKYWGNGLLFYICNYVNGDLFGFYETHYQNGTVAYQYYYAR
jgi:antitoxin component YwqK of YwqJK toxin-antitoxin module